MADRLDVAERLAEGRPAVEHTQTYVQACHALGYEHPEMTAHPSQIRDRYATEDGLDLRALDRDCAELRAAGAALMEALRLQRAQIAELAAAWTGPGGDAAVGFLERHVDAAGVVATEVRAAAQRCESLRDNLWYLVDSKVTTAIAIDDRTQPQRSAWLAAAAAVTTGTGDRAAAEEVIRQQVNPYVDNEIRDDWLTVMRSTTEGVTTSYDMVTDRMAAAPLVRFESPGEFGSEYEPRPTNPPPPPAVVAPAAIPAAPVDQASPSTAAPPAPPVTTAPPAAASTAAPPAAASLPAAPLSDLGTALGGGSALPGGDLGGAGGLGGGLGGLGGLAGRIVDAMSSLLGPGADEVGADDPFDEDPFHPDDEHTDDEHHETEDRHKHGPDEAEDTKEADHSDDAKPAGNPEPVAATPPLDAPPVQAPPSPADAPTPVAAPAPAAVPPDGGPSPGATPCEIAADQLPQAGQ
jgi:hypothetical protein